MTAVVFFSDPECVAEVLSDYFANIVQLDLTLTTLSILVLRQ